MLLELEHITFSFGNEEEPVLNDLSLSLDKGMIYALMGENGSGKTTLFNIITGFHKPSKGEIYFNQRNISQLSPYEISGLGIGRTFQDLRLIKKLTVKENVLLTMKRNPTDLWYKSVLPNFLFKKTDKAFDSKANSILEEYFLTDIKDSLAGEISYGQQKLLTLACCIASNAELLLLDEPLAGVNEEFLQKIQDKIIAIRKSDKTILLIDHHIEFLDRISETIFFLNDGKINSYKSMSQFRNDPKILDSFI